jgi:hypothetical protein
MKPPISEKIYKEVKKIALEVKTNLRRNGFVIPTVLKDGSINVDGYLIVKTDNFYEIKNIKNQSIVDSINLPQTAALLANDLALGKWLDTDLVARDRYYGYKNFEEQLTKKSAVRYLKRNDLDRAELMFTKWKIAKSQALVTKNDIIANFEKLRRLR